MSTPRLRPGRPRLAVLSAFLAASVLTLAAVTPGEGVQPSDSIVPAAAPTPPQAKKAVAVLRFDNNTGDEKYETLGRAFATMMTSDLSVVEEIQLVERERIEEVLGELKLQHSGYVDPESAQTLGLIVGAEYVVAGAFMTVDPQMRIDTRIIRVETSEILKTAEVTGETNQLLELEERLAEEFVDGLGVVLTEGDRETLRAQQEANQIGDLETALAFSQALCYLDGGAYADAFDRLQEVQAAAPGSMIVRLTLDRAKDRLAEEAKDQAVNRAGRAIGGLLGRKRAPQRTEAPRPNC